MPDVSQDSNLLEGLLANSPAGTDLMLPEGLITFPYGELPKLVLPEITLWCDTPNCNRAMFFEPTPADVRLSKRSISELFFVYICKHCEANIKRFAMLIEPAMPDSPVRAVKVGEWPSFGPPIPSRVSELVGPDREWLFKGYRAERQGFGIGALAYYRRVIENQRTRILSEVIKVAQRTRSGPNIIETLELAKSETQFTKSLELARDAIPPVLLIDGHNPLRILHSATSEGIHALSDEESLENATAIRIVLFDLAQRIGEALRSEDGLRKSLSRLLGTSATEKSSAASGR